jgi:hypothetical protein
MFTGNHGGNEPAEHFCFGEIFRQELSDLLPDEPIPDRDPHTKTEADAYAETLLDWVDGRTMPLAALCLSGGGIRSASFALGALQALARAGVLTHFHYLSTVSGGGYIGAWLTAFRRRAGSDADVLSALNQLEDEGQEPAEIDALRANSNYLTPKLGILSADTWAVISSYLRNLVLNWVVFGPLFLAVLILPQLCARLLSELAVQPGYWVRLLQLGAGVALLVGLLVAEYGRFHTRGQWITDRRYLGGVLVPLVFAAVCLAGLARMPGQTGEWKEAAIATAAIYGAAAIIGRLMASLPPGGVKDRSQPGAGNWSSVFSIVARIVCGAIVGVLMSIGFDLAADVRLAAPRPDRDAILVIFGASWVVLSVQVGELLYNGLTSYSPRSDMDQEWLARSAGWMAAAAMSWAILAAIGLYGPFILTWGFGGITTMLAGGVSGVIAIGFGASARTAATVMRQTGTRLSTSQLVSVAGILFALFLAILLAWVDGRIFALLAQRLGPTDPAVSGFPGPMSMAMAATAVILASLALGASVPVNVNRFSLHALYRNRLIRAFLGATRGGRRDPDPFTGFDPADNMRMADTIPPGTAPPRLLHVINVALNVVSSRRLAWQERKAEAFSITALACGNPNVGYRAATKYGAPHGMSLGTAMAISGAAVSPNQGYHSSPIVGFLLMLFNVRLGWWLGNPRRGRESRRAGPRIGLLPALRELAGATTDDERWIYLSDGGHFENLGIYEMVRRHCRLIVVSDAGCDPNTRLEDLGNAVRKCFIDFGVRIEFEQLDLPARPTAGAAGAYCAIGRINYPGDAPDGWLLYVKPAYHGTERPDVRGYALAHPEFPHETTVDQWFTESQFEAYRALGEHIFELICRGDGAPSDPASTSPDLARLRAWAEGYVEAVRARTARQPAAPPIGGNG